MKTIEQLLALSKNPYYKMTSAEKQVLDDFLSQKKADHSTSSVKQKKNNSESNTPVTVRNIVPKVIDEVEESGQ